LKHGDRINDKKYAENPEKISSRIERFDDVDCGVLPLDRMMPLMGAAQLSVFAGFSIYLPELFGARTRATGVSFAYNLGRFAAAGGSFFSAYLATTIFGMLPEPLPLRYSAMTMCLVFLVGLAAALRAPETRNAQLRS